MYIYIWGKRSGERNEKRRGVVLEMAQKYKKKAADEFSFYLTREIFGQTVNSCEYYFSNENTMERTKLTNQEKIDLSFGN